MVAVGLWVGLGLGFASCVHDDGAAGTGPGAGGDAAAPCPILFGQPNGMTGLGPSQCQPRCDCDGTSFVPPVYSAAFIQSLVDGWQLATPYAPLSSDPYAAAPPPADAPATVCAVLPQGAAGVAPRARTRWPPTPPPPPRRPPGPR